MLMDHIRGWLLGRPTPSEQPAKPRDQRDAGRAAAACGPKPVVEAVGDALAAVGELVSSIRANSKKPVKHRKRRASPKRARAPRPLRGVVVVEAVRVEPRPASVASSRGESRTTRARTRILIRDDAPIIVAPATRAASSRSDGT